MSKINWKLRLQNKATLLSLAALVITFIYSVLGLFGVTPPVSQDDTMNVVVIVVQVLMAVGIVVDPTTKGISDSKRALEYNSPKVETEDAK